MKKNRQILLELAEEQRMSAGVVPDCDASDRFGWFLMAQSVPSATLILRGVMPVGWSFTGSSVQNNLANLWLSSTVAGQNAVQAQLTASCDPGGAPEVVPAPDEAGARVYEAPDSLNPFRATRYVVFTGGCVTYRYTFATGVRATLSLQADDAFSFMPRSDVVRAVQDGFGRTLCGADAPPCPGPMRAPTPGCSRIIAEPSVGPRAARGGRRVAVHRGEASTELAPLTTVRFVGRFDLTVNRAMDDIRILPLTWLCRVLNVLGSGWVDDPGAGRRRALPRAPPALGPAIAFALTWATSEFALTMLKASFHRGRPPNPLVVTQGFSFRRGTPSRPRPRAWRSCWP